MHMKAQSPSLDLQIKQSAPNCEEVGKCHCGGLVVFHHRFRADPPRVECTNCGHEDPKFRELGWIDAKFRKDDAQQAMQSGMFSIGLLELLDEAKQTAIRAGQFYHAARFEFMASILDISEPEIDELDADGWFKDHTNLALKLRSSQMERDEIVCEQEDLQRLIDQARSAS